MKKNFLLLALMPAIVMTSCKNDSEDDLNTDTSAVSGLYINEVCSSNVDWVELYNATDNEVSLTGFRLQDNKGTDEEYISPEGTVIKSHQYLVLEKEASFTFGISSGGDEIKLLDAQYQTIDQVIVPALEVGATYARVSDGASQWAVTLSPTKGGSNSIAAPATLKGIVVINEIYTFSDQTKINDLDYIEFYNTSSQDVDMSGLKIWEGGGVEKAWTIPAGKTIPAYGFLVIESDKEGLHNDPANYPSWGLSKNEELVVLADADLNIIDEIVTPNMSEGESYGRRTDGGSEWVVFTTISKNASNNGMSVK